MLPSADYPQDSRSHLSESQDFEQVQDRRVFEQPTSEQLKAAISKTVERAAQFESNAPSEVSELLIFAAIARLYPDQVTLAHSPAAVELVTALAVSVLPATLFRRVIERFSSEIAQQLLSDPIASRHLNLAWNAARHSLGLTAQ